MSEIKRKLVITIAIVLSAALLTGCERDENPPAPTFSYIYDSGENSLGISSPASSSSRSSANSGAVSSPEASGSAPVPVIPPDFSISEETGTFDYSKSPDSPVTVTFGDNVIVVKMRGTGFTGVQQSYPEMNIARSFDGENSVFTLTPAVNNLKSGFGSFFIIDKHNYLGEVDFAIRDGKIAAPELRTLSENNQSVIDSVVVASDERVAQAMTLYGSTNRIPEIWKEIEKISNEICEGIDDDYEKLYAIADWVSDNIYYDRPAVRQGEPPSCLTLEYMLNNKSGICGSYANMTAALCNAQGIRCISIIGKALIDGNNYLETSLEGGLHEWNVAEIDGRQIIVDSCWMSMNNLDYGGHYTHKKNVWKWFDVGDEIFAIDHRAVTAEYRDFKALAESLAN